MQPHQQRVVDEKSELDDKLAKLTVFFSTSIFVSLPEEERDLLKHQAQCMSAYSFLLSKRIEKF